MFFDAAGRTFVKMKKTQGQQKLGRRMSRSINAIFNVVAT